MEALSKKSSPGRGEAPGGVNTVCTHTLPLFWTACGQHEKEKQCWSMAGGEEISSSRWRNSSGAAGSHMGALRGRRLALLSSQEPDSPLLLSEGVQSLPQAMLLQFLGTAPAIPPAQELLAPCRPFLGGGKSIVVLLGTAQFLPTWERWRV